MGSWPQLVRRSLFKVYALSDDMSPQLGLGDEPHQEWLLRKGVQSTPVYDRVRPRSLLLEGSHAPACLVIQADKPTSI